ncbi:MAG: PDZ domain-containing protein, partial [Calditrichaeota bacterium]|nr:PDZ domain-containing protein [Calditrichota bacterium]
EWVLAIGSPLEENFAHTVTAGIISAKGRTGVGLTQYEDFIQTDAAINPGNSGGALVNLKGELIGINTAIASRSGGNIGIGFAIPSNLASKVKSDIITRGKVVRGWLGVNIRDITPEFAKMYDLKTDEGVLIREVVQDGPAEAAGVQAGDVVVALDGKKIRNVTELSTKVGSTEPDKTVKLEVLRDGKTKEIAVKLGEFPEDENLLAGGSSIRGGAQKVSSLGFEVKDLNDNLRRAYDFSSSDEGVVITSISESSIAARAGLQEGDLIVKINRDFVENLGDFQKVLDTLEPGDAVAFFLKRGDRKLVVDFIVPKV